MSNYCHLVNCRTILSTSSIYDKGMQDRMNDWLVGRLDQLKLLNKVSPCVLVDTQKNESYALRTSSQSYPHHTTHTAVI